MSYLTDIMKNRQNIQFFKKEAPDRQVIDDILRRAHQLVPHKNNFWYYKIRVYGPEHEEEKKLIAMASVTNDRFKNGTAEDMEKLAQIYHTWTTDRTRKTLKVEGCNFNMQVTAPYLLVYTHQPDFMTETQKESDYNKSGNQKKSFTKNTNSIHSTDWVTQAAMHGISTAYMCAEQGLHASFCKCYFYNEHIKTDILREGENTAFMLGIGYKDETKNYYPSPVTKPAYEEIVEWK